MSLTTLRDIGLDDMAPFQLTPLPEYLPVLQQPKAKMTTNIPDQTQIKIIEVVKTEQENNKISDLTVGNIINNISDSFEGITNDLYNKPKDVTLVTYVIEICQKDDRYFYIGLMLLIIVFILLIFN